MSAAASIQADFGSENFAFFIAKKHSRTLRTRHTLSALIRPAFFVFGLRALPLVTESLLRRGHRTKPAIQFFRTSYLLHSRGVGGSSGDAVLGITLHEGNSTV